ncbi:MAG: carboxyl transferase domain-containing protein, partial [Clostridiaceae bacterium]
DVENYSNLDELVNSFKEQDSEIEINADFEKEIKTSLVKINGLTVGVVGVGRENEVKLDGAKLDKITKMVKLCNSFNMPILTLVNSDGFVKSIEEEKNGLSFKAAKLSAVIASATVPKVSLIVGKSYGAVFTMLSDRKASFDVVYALKTSKIALTDVKTQVSVLYKEDIKNASNKEEKINELVKLNEEALSSSIKAAEKGYIDDVLENEDIAIKIIASFEMLKTKREIGYSKKHGSILV